MNVLPLISNPLTVLDEDNGKHTNNKLNLIFFTKNQKTYYRLKII